MKRPLSTLSTGGNRVARMFWFLESYEVVFGFDEIGEHMTKFTTSSMDVRSF